MAHLVFCCSDAREAYRNKELVWSAHVGGWTLTTVPLRSSTGSAKWFGWERQLEYHDGEPYRFDACPYCRADKLPYGPLPYSTPDDPKSEGQE